MQIQKKNLLENRKLADGFERDNRDTMHVYTSNIKYLDQHMNKYLLY